MAYINVDSYSVSSVVHQNQDYVLHFQGQYPFTVVSDGCSGAKYSDIAARLLVWKACSIFSDSVKLSEHYLGLNVLTKKVLFPYDEFGLRVINQSQVCRDQHFPNVQELAATLIFGAALPDGIHVYMYGDGHILAKRRKTGYVEHKVISQKNNAPYYLSYWGDGFDYYSYTHGSQCVVRSHYDYDTHYHLVGEEYLNFNDHLEWVFPYDKYESVALVTDGISDFRKNSFSTFEEKYEHMQHLVRELLSFKTTAGEFTVRRTRKILKNLAKDEVSPYDDFSVGCFVIKED